MDKNFLYVIQDQLKTDVISVTNLSGGKNSCVYRLSCADKKDYVVKFYFFHKSDKRNRLITEFSALQFLYSNDIEYVPEPLLMNNDYGFSVFEFINGKRIKSENVSYEDIQTLINFLLRLNQLKYYKDALKINNASEACFSINDYIKSIDLRLNRLKQLDKKKSIMNERLLIFICEKFLPVFENTKKRCNSLKMDCNKKLTFHQKTLSPSDYGFHNALRLIDKKIKFIDFEYFGWDDPAKMICDFLLHPAMNLSFDRKNYFYNLILKHFEDAEILKERIHIVYSLVALKWCMILLNEFVPEFLLRRNFSGDCKNNVEIKQKKQLKKSELMLKKVIKEYENFPFK